MALLIPEAEAATGKHSRPYYNDAERERIEEMKRRFG